MSLLKSTKKLRFLVPYLNFICLLSYYMCLILAMWCMQVICVMKHKLGMPAFAEMWYDTLVLWYLETFQKCVLRFILLLIPFCLGMDYHSNELKKGCKYIWSSLKIKKWPCWHLFLFIFPWWVFVVWNFEYLRLL